MRYNRPHCAKCKDSGVYYEKVEFGSTFADMPVECECVEWQDSLCTCDDEECPFCGGEHKREEKEGEWTQFGTLCLECYRWALMKKSGCCKAEEDRSYTFFSKEGVAFCSVEDFSEGYEAWLKYCNCDCNRLFGNVKETEAA